MLVIVIKLRIIIGGLKIDIKLITYEKTICIYLWTIYLLHKIYIF
jgi:hypothetical protein